MTSKESTKYAVEVGARLTTAIRAADLTVASLARLLAGAGHHVEQNQLYKHTKGRQLPGLERAAILADALGVSLAWLAHGEESADAPAVFGAWLETPRGRTASTEARAFLRAIPMASRTPSPIFYDLALTAFEAGIAPSIATTGAAQSAAEVARQQRTRAR